MSDSAIWGIAVLLYVLPYCFWYFSHLETIEIKKKLYPGSDELRKTDNLATFVGLAWAASLAVLLVLWAIGAHPIPSFLLSCTLFALAALSKWLLRTKLRIRSRSARATVALIALWLLSVGAWYVGFGRRADLDLPKLVVLFLAPPVLGLGAIALYGWVRKGAGNGEA